MLVNSAYVTAVVLGGDTVMSDVRGNLCDPCPDPVRPLSNEAPGPDLQR